MSADMADEDKDRNIQSIPLVEEMNINHEVEEYYEEFKDP